MAASSLNLAASRQNALLLAAALLPWAFDFRASEGQAEGWSQLITLLVSCVFVGIFLLKSANVRLSPPIMAFLGAVGLFLAGSVLSSFANGLPARETVAAAVPVMLLFLFGLAGFRFATNTDHPEALVNALVPVAVFSAVIKVVLNISFGIGSGVVDARYGVLPGANSLLIAMAVVAMTLPVGRNWKIIAAFSLIPTFLSTTRSILLSLVIPLGFASASRPKLLVRITLIVIIAAVAVWLLDWLASNTIVGQMIDYWRFRLVGQRQELGFDLTGDIRRSEVLYMLQEFSSSFSHVLFGNGIAAQTSLNDQTIREMMNYVGDLSDFRIRGFGHNNYVSLLFTGGIVFGGPLLIMLIILFVQALTALIRLPRLQTTPLVVLTLWNAAACACTLLQSTLSAPMLDRASSSFLGLSIGLFYGGSVLVREQSTERKRLETANSAGAQLVARARDLAKARNRHLASK